MSGSRMLDTDAFRAQLNEWFQTPAIEDAIEAALARGAQELKTVPQLRHLKIEQLEAVAYMAGAFMVKEISALTVDPALVEIETAPTALGWQEGGEI